MSGSQRAADSGQLLAGCGIFWEQGVGFRVYGVQFGTYVFDAPEICLHSQKIIRSQGSGCA